MHDGACSRCGMSLPAGNVAVYERATRTIHCVECPPAGGDLELPDPEPDPGIAGGSTLREYERRKAGREARVRDRFGNRLGRVVLALTSEPQSTRAWAIGAKGEVKLAQALEGIDGLRVIGSPWTAAHHTERGDSDGAYAGSLLGCRDSLGVIAAPGWPPIMDGQSTCACARRAPTPSGARPRSGQVNSEGRTSAWTIWNADRAYHRPSSGDGGPATATTDGSRHPGSTTPRVVTRHRQGYSRP